MQPQDPEVAPPRPRYVIGSELASGRVLRLADADSLVWGQTCLIQVAASMRAGGGEGVVVLVDAGSGEVRDRITVPPGGRLDE